MITSSLIASVALCFGALVGRGINYVVLDDPDDTSSFSNAYSLQEGVSYDAVFSDPNDIDYYTFVAVNSVNAFVKVTCQTENVNIDVFNYSTNSNHSLYDLSFLTPTDPTSNNVFFVAHNETLRIKVSSTSNSAFYSIKVLTNLSNSTYLVESLFNNNIKCESYYGVIPRTATIKYKIDSSCNVYLGNGYYISDAYDYALQYWNRLGLVNLVSVSLNQDVLLTTASTSFFESLVTNPPGGHVLGYTHKVYTPLLLQFGYNYETDYVRVPSDTAYVSQYSWGYSLYMMYKCICVHEVGHTLGIKDFAIPDDEDDYLFNIMNATMYIYGFQNYNFGDKDLATYKYIWGI